MKLQTLTFVMLLLCFMTVAPVMAGPGTRTIEDGVYLVKFDASPTELDPHYYNMPRGEDFVVEGDQFYWVRIGSVRAEGLTSVWWLNFAVITMFLFPIIFTLIVWYYESKRRFPLYHAKVFSPRPGQSFVTGWKNMVVFLIPVMLVGLVSMMSVVSGMLPAVFTHVACDGYVDLQASDGTILLKVDKLHPEANNLFARSGLNISTLTHLSSSGKIDRPRSWSGTIYDLGVPIL